MDEKILPKVPASMEIVKPVEGQVSTYEWKKILWNFISYTLPIYFGAFFTTMVLTKDVKISALAGLSALYGPLADYFKKRQSGDAYLREK